MGSGGGLPVKDRFFELSPDPCCVMTLDGAIEASNGAWFPVLGYTDRDLERRSFLELVHPDDRARVEVELVRHELSTFAARCRATNGAYRLLHWRSVATIEAQRIYAIGRAELATLARSERMLALGQVALGVVHDLKNVLVHPLGLQLQRVDRAVSEKSAEKARAALSAMRAILRDGLDAIDRMQKFGNPGPRPVLARVDVENLTWRATEIARAYLRSLAVLREIELEYEAGKPKRIEADGFELLAAFVNIMVNAIDAVAEHGSKVSVRTGQSTAKRRVWIEIADDGAGMSSEVRARIFEPFFTTKHDGVGIGLAMVKSCIERHAGTIDVASEPGRGTTVRIELPMP